MEKEQLTKQQKNKRTGCLAIFVGIIVIFVSIYILLSVFDARQESAYANKNQNQNQKPMLECLSHTIKNDKYTRYVTGRIINNTEQTFSYVEVDINLYDMSGNVTESTLSNVLNLGPGKIWYFEAPILNDKSKKHEITDIRYKK